MEDLKSLDQTTLDALRKTFNTYDEGIYIEPDSIDVSEKRYVLYERLYIGGYSGGSCWGGKPRYEQSEYVEPFAILAKFVLEICPNISLNKFKRLEEMVKNNEETSYEYYGNSSDYRISWIAIDDICNELGIEINYKNELCAK